jgi:UDP-N-acetylglucosamine--N-acetylmuramyl-(pentapeptide) pyrophosphoryl-undecaprenol N-acetylglucosamine transferase
MRPEPPEIMKILICGGHLTPALAIIDALPKDTHVLYVGRKHGLEGDNAHSLEYQVIKEKNIPFVHINAGKLQRKLTKHTIPSLLKLPRGFLEAFTVLKKFRPDVVVGFGGYVSVPLGIAAYFLKIPVIIHEQTFASGLANKLLSRVASTICLSWDSSLEHFPKEKSVITGNPAVSEIFHETSQTTYVKKSNLPLLVIVGGSLGSHAINALVERVLNQLLEQFQILHQTGDAKEFADYDRLYEKKDLLPKELQERYTLTKFINPREIIATLTKADLVVTRAGINTITTLLMLHKPSLVIPLPSSQKNDQYKNAHMFASYGLGIAVTQESLSPERFLELIFDMIKTPEKFVNKKGEKELEIHKSATNTLVKIITDYAQKKNYKTQNTKRSS